MTSAHTPPSGRKKTMFADPAAPASRPSHQSLPTGGIRSSTPLCGRFLQADPIGYGDGMNMYGYVGGDPVNRSDPSGLSSDIVVTGERPWLNLWTFGYGFGRGTPGPLRAEEHDDGDILVTGVRPRRRSPQVAGDASRSGPFREQSDNQQAQNCRTNPIIRYSLSLPVVQQQISRALDSSEAAAGGRSFYEHGF